MYQTVCLSASTAEITRAFNWRENRILFSWSPFLHHRVTHDNVSTMYWCLGWWWSFSERSAYQIWIASEMSTDIFPVLDYRTISRAKDGRSTRQQTARQIDRWIRLQSSIWWNPLWMIWWTNGTERVSGAHVSSILIRDKYNQQLTIYVHGYLAYT